IIQSCGSSTTTPEKCVPGQSIACAGDDGCSGYQSCKHDGSAYDPCICSATVSSSSTGPASSSGSGGAGGTGGAATTGSGGMAGNGGMMAWTPKSLPGLVLWLDVDVGTIDDPQNPGTMLKWLDQSGNQNNAVATNIQQGFRFVYDPAAANGHQAIKCPAGA